MLVKGSEKARRMPYTGHRHHIFQRGKRRALLRVQVDRIARPQRHRDFTRFRAAAVNNNRIYLPQTRSALAHRPGRQPPAVAEAADAVDHHNFAIALQRVVLQAIVGNDEIEGVTGEQRFNCGAALRRHRDRRPGALGDQHWFVARLLRRRIGVDQQRIALRFAAVAA